MQLKFFLIAFILSCCFGTAAVQVQNEPKLNCTCVPYYQCSFESGDLIIDGKGLLNLRIEETPCVGYFDVCCNITKEILFPSTEAPEEYHGCGYQKSGFFPWYAGLFFRKSTEDISTYKCGASLIHPRVILTTAHCLNENGIWTVRVGNAFRQVAKVITHAEYNDETMHNDIALAILKKPLEISEKINTICIPPPGINLNDARCRIISRITNEKDEVFLKILQVNVIPKDNCLELLQATYLGQFFRLHKSFLCGDTERGRETCEGIGGSPLVCPVPGQPERYHQVGIVSWGIDCEEHIPDVYVKVPFFRNWIDTEMTKNGLDIISYRY